MLRRLKLLILADFRERYSNRLIWLGETFNIVAGLFIYRFTAKAFAPNFEFRGVKLDYFAFIILGESALMIPLVLMEGGGRFLKTLCRHQALDELLLQKNSGRNVLIYGALAEIPRTLYRLIVTILFSVLFFDLSVSPLHLLKFVYVILIFSPVFVGLGLLLTSGILITGRGWRTITTFGLMMSVLSGAYFPTQVLPERLQFLTSTLLPHAALIQATRLSFLDLPNAEYLHEMQGLTATAAGWAILLSALGFVTLQLALRSIQKRNTPLFLPES